MLDPKNLSPRHFSLINATIIATMNLGLSLLFGLQWYHHLLVFSLTFLLSYQLYLYSVQRFVFRKIKLIYKFIYTTKASKKEAYFHNHILPPKNIEDVEKDVKKWAEQYHREIELLKANEKFRKEFLSNLAHELRTPIFTIQGYVDTLIGGALDDVEVRDRFLKNTARGIDRLAQLVDDIDEISQLESGSIPLEKKNFVLRALVEDVFDELSLMAENQHITLRLKKGTEMALSVHADPSKLRQVLVNLIENAIKYNHRGGTVTVGAYAIDGNHIYTEVSDTGPGIAEEHIGRIFERFYRADRSRNRQVGGTGLGLAIVKHIIEAHGHTLTVRSRLGIGTSIGFTLDKAKDGD